MSGAAKKSLQEMKKLAQRMRLSMDDDDVSDLQPIRDSDQGDFHRREVPQVKPIEMLPKHGPAPEDEEKLMDYFRRNK